jgi:glucokinase
MPVTIGVDIGGSHISSAAVHIDTYKIIPETYFKSPVNSKTSKEEIFRKWGNVINQTLEKVKDENVMGIGIAMPGPFQYKTGIAMFEGNDKYESLHKVSIASELPYYLNGKNLAIRFLNDASSFGIGGALINKIGKNQKIVALTLGTGFGAAFLKNHVPVVNDELVPEGGCLWDKVFLDGIADDYFSTRWFLSKYEEYTGDNNIGGVKEIVDTNSPISLKLFEEFALNFSEFMLPHLTKFDADLLIIGGNISKSHHLFLPAIIQKLKEKGCDISVEVIDNTDKACIIGSSYLFEPDFWNKVKEELPER